MNNLYFGDNLDVLQQKIKDEFVEIEDRWSADEASIKRHHLVIQR